MKKNKEIWLILLISILLILPQYFNGYYRGHDTRFHVANISSITEQISLRNPIPSGPIPNVANNFGYGTRIFYPPVPHLVSAYFTKGLSLFKINDVTIGMRITQWLTIFLSGITFYMMAKNIFKEKKELAFLSSILYMTYPYHLSEIFIRDAFSEMFIPIAIPLIILGLMELLEQKYHRFLLFFVLGYVIAIFSHLAMIIYFTLILVFTFFLIYFRKIFTKKNILYLILASILILGLTSPFWVPLLEHKIKGSYAIFMPYFITGKGDLIHSAISPLHLIDFLKPHNYDFIRFNMMAFEVILIIFAGIQIVKKKLWKEKVWLFWIIFTILSIIMITPLFPWYYTPDLLQTLQFPWRLCLYIGLGISVIATLGVQKFERNRYYKIIIGGLTLLALGGGYFYTYHSSNEKIDINQIDYNLGLGNQAEYLPENTIHHREYFESRSEDIIKKSGSGEINCLENEVPEMKYQIVNAKDLTIELPRLYYLGYQLVNENNETINIFQNENGFLEVPNITDGEYKLTYPNTQNSHIAQIVAIVSLFSWLGIYIYQKRND